MIAPESKHRDGHSERHPAHSLPPQAGFPPQACGPPVPGAIGPGATGPGAMWPEGMGPNPLGQSGGAFPVSVPPQLAAAVSAARSALGGAGGRLPLPVLIATAAVLGVTAGWLIKRR